MHDLIFNDQGFGTATRLVPWTDLRALGIRTTADGPYAEDLFWVFLLPTGTVEVPGELMSSGHLAALQAYLPGFDDGKVIAATTSTEPRWFRVWHPDAARAGWDETRFRERFRQLVKRLGGEPGSADQTFQRLTSAWSEPHRRYHALEHLAECLFQLDLSGQLDTMSPVPELALWFHDAVYVARAHDNEERSAQLLLHECQRLQIAPAQAQAAADLVRATAHGATSGDLSPEAALALDADLSILGSDPLRFMDYEYGIEEEFVRVPTLQFRIGRGRFLAALLARPTIFRTAFFREKYEEAARAQVAALLGSPRYRAFRVTNWLRHPLRRTA